MATATIPGNPVTGQHSRFDWYQPTFDALDAQHAVHYLADVLGCRVELGKGLFGYARCDLLNRGDDELARVYSQSARPGEVHMVVSGQSCDEVVPIVRGLWPDHRVSRVDSAADLLVDFGAIDERCVAFAEERRLSYRLVTDSAGGATRYLGAPSSEVRVRVYRKTEEWRAKHPERPDAFPDGVVRFEIQVRPGKREMKARVAAMSPADVWGLSGWGQAFADEFLALDVERVPTHHRKPSDWAHSLFYLALQYGPLVRARAADVGVAEVLGEIVEAWCLTGEVGSND